MQGRDAVRRNRTLGTAHRAVQLRTGLRPDPTLTAVRNTAHRSRALRQPTGLSQSSWKSRGDFRTAGFGPQRVEGAGLVGAAVGVGAEVVTLALNQGGGQTVGTQAVVVGQ